MRVPLHWLHEYVRPDLDPSRLAERLAMTGTEVDRVHHHGVDNLDAFVVGKVLEAVPHPGADRLRVCTVDIAEEEPSQIVCGAPNVAAGQTVAVARPGAIMPDGTRLKAAKLRGVVSAGMICAEDELGIGTEHDGILVLDDHLRAGEALTEALPIADEVLELEITPNRPDCLGVYGVAREVHAATGAPLAPPPWAEDPGAGPGTPPAEIIRVDVEAPDLCPRFTARAFEGVRIGPSPRWLKARLMAAGQRPINNVVDITNYVMLLTGQPVHAFDLDRIAGGRLVVRRGRRGRRFTTLDGAERELDEDTCVIEDDAGPTSLAGIMGGQRSEVEPGTTRVLMEAATWDGPNINRTMARLSLRSEAGARFEKGLAPEQAMDAQAVATHLMLDLTGARLVPGTVDHRSPSATGGPEDAPATIRLRDARLEGLLGMPVPRDEARRTLAALEFGVADAADGLDVTVPPFRRKDVTREADLIEEVARLGGLERLPATLPPNRLNRAGRLSAPQLLRRRAEDVLVGQGLHEVAGWSFTARDLLDKLRIPPGHALRDVIELQNPMSEGQAIMRPTILGSLLDVAAHNVAHGMADLALFESAAVYRRRADGDGPGAFGPPADEHHALAVLLHGAPAPRAWTGEGPSAADVFAAKGILEAVLGALRVEASYAPGSWPFLHPGRAAEVVAADGARLGFVGEVHPLVARAWDLPHTAAAWAVDLGKVIARAPDVQRYRDLTSFPALTQDLAVVVGEEVPAARVLEVVRAAAGARLAEVSVFDVYRGGQLGAGRKSLALHCAFRAPDRTLTDADVAPLREKVVARLASELGGELRG